MRRLWIVLLAVVVVVVSTSVWQGDYLFAAAYAVGGLALVWWTAPWRGGRTITHQEVLAMPESERPVVVYWRPGCGYCQRLRHVLGEDAGRATWVNIWQDEEAAAFVRSANDGNETVPTVVIDGIPHTNPDAETVRAGLTA
ncbi:glutaredoxin domain-containing protein [Ornithinimicrobium tianjinense]|uniref:Membrane protein n=1 Tax=Ornithinimicrobium tianjinense TaxID=1195761 RepID=A0A917BG39_9MICO|nr:glutaredoxin domain-containing protein [Ornithinimicrobium tianjinense]GGF41660.1 membrane protein [Ornithinimicrobium tianjinense]